MVWGHWSIIGASLVFFKQTFAIWTRKYLAKSNQSSTIGKSSEMQMLRNTRRCVIRSIWRSYSDRPEPWQMDKLTDIGSRKIFNEEHDILRESVRKFYSKVDLARKVKWEEQGFVDRDFWLEAGAQGQSGTVNPSLFQDDPFGTFVTLRYGENPRKMFAGLTAISKLVIG